MKSAPADEATVDPHVSAGHAGRTTLVQDINPPSPHRAPVRPVPAREAGRATESAGILDAEREIECKHVRYAAAKRIFDILFAIVLLVFASPIMLITGLLVRLTSRGPIIFKQVRVGRGGRCFTCYKFRSMCEDAEEKKRTLQHLNEVDGPVFKIKRDPRMTPVGAVIRKFSIDELPQLFNVIKGDMSVVGPRPPVPAEVEKYTPRERGRLAVQPGLTCLWQISGRSNLPYDRWVELDLEYIEKMSFATDVRIVALTIPAVVTGAGAH